MDNVPSNADLLVNSPVEPQPKPLNGIDKREGHTFDPGRQESLTEAPPNLQGKDSDGIIEDYKKLQSERGRQAQEIGELRRQIAELQESKLDDVSEPDYWGDPEKAIDARVRKDIEPVRKELEGLKAEKLRLELSNHHPDWADIVQRPEFGEWTREKRSRILLAMSGDAGDVESARELLDQYKEAMATGESTPVEAVRRDRVARASATERGTGRRPSGKVWSRTELQNMRAYNPQRYQELLPEIKRAYTDGRVRNE